MSILQLEPENKAATAVNGNGESAALRRDPVLEEVSSESIEAANRVVAGLERNHPVNELRYGEIRIWPAVRSMLLFYFGQRRGLLAEPLQPPLASPSLPSLFSTIGARVARLATSFDAVLAENRFAKDFVRLEESTILFVGRRGTRSLLIEKRAFDVQIDPIIALVDGHHSWKKLLIAPDEVRGERTYYPTTVVDLASYLSWLGAFGRLTDILFPDRMDLISGWDAMIAELPKVDGTPPLSSNTEALRSYCRAIDGLSGLIGHVLERVKPKLVVFVGQNATAFAIALACYRRGIACVDVQHGAGAASQGNVKWFGWRQVPPGGYELLPDYFFVWNKEAVNRIETTMGGATDRHVPVLGGNQWIDLCRREFPEPPPVPRPAKMLRILVTLTQRSVGEMPGHILEAMEKGSKHWRWMVRLHPEDMSDPKNLATMKEKLETRQLTNAEVYKASNYPLPQLLRKADRHVTMYSSTCIEATAFGLATIFTDPRATHLLPDIVGRPGFPLALTCDELIHALEATPSEGVAPLIESDPKAGLAAIESMLTGGPKRSRSKSGSSRF